MDFTTKCLDIMDTSMNDLKDHEITSLQVLDESIISDKHSPGKKALDTQIVHVVALQPDISVEIASSNSTSPISNYTENTAHIDGYSPGLSLDNIQQQLDIGQTFLHKEPDTIEVTENGLNGYPDLICSINDNIVCDDPIDLNNIQLYLECFDDSENLTSSSSFENDASSSVQTGTSLLKSDVRLKISFPVFPEEGDQGYKCCACKTYFESEDGLRSHVIVEHKQETCMCPFCFYNTKSKKYFKNHIQTKHKVLIDNLTKQNEGYTELETQQLQSLVLGNVGEDKTNVSTTNNWCNSDMLSRDQGMASTTTNSNIVDSGADIESQETSITHRENIGNKQSTVTTGVISPGMDGLNDKFVCSSCKFVTKTLKLLKMHMNAMHDSNRMLFQCSQCSYICKQKRSFLAHTQLHEGSFNFKCEICSKEFVSKSIYTRHKKNHYFDRHHVCDYKHCRKAFKTKGALTDHKKKVHSSFTTRSESTSESVHLKSGKNSTSMELGLNSEKYECEQQSLDNLLSIKNNGTNEMTIPANETDCPVPVLSMCPRISDYTYSESNNVEEMNTSTASGTYFVGEKCMNEKAGVGEIGTCDKNTCTASDGIVLELQTKHSDTSRGFVHIDTCKNELNAKTNMEKIHVANGKIQMGRVSALLSKGNSEKGHLMKAKHTGTQTKQSQGKMTKTKSFICPYTHCQKTFRDNFNLRNHMCTHEGVKNLKCELCDFGCVQKSSLNYHMKSKHSDVQCSLSTTPNGRHR